MFCNLFPLPDVGESADNVQRYLLLFDDSILKFWTKDSFLVCLTWTLIMWMQWRDPQMHGNLASRRKLRKSWLCKKHIMLSWWLSRNQCSRVRCPHFLIGACSNHYIIWLECEEKKKNSSWAQKKKQTNLVSTVNLSHGAATSKARYPRFEMKRIWSTTCANIDILQVSL